MIAFTLIVVAILIVLTIALNKLLKRNRQVAAFRHKINHACHTWSIQNLHSIIEEKETSAYEWLYKKMPPYDAMLYSTKPLEYKYWFDEKDIKKLLSL